MREISFSGMKKLLNPRKVINGNLYRCPDRFGIDSRSECENSGFIAVKGKFFDGHDFISQAVDRGARVVISESEAGVGNPGVCYFIVNDTYKALASLSGKVRELKNPFLVGVTGSVGKTTTKEMLACILENHAGTIKSERSENNFLGVCKTLLNLREQDYAVLELGTSSMGEIRTLAEICSPDMGIITFIGPAHMEGLPGIKDVLAEKASLLRHGGGVVGILNRDDSRLRGESWNNKVYWFGRGRGADLSARLVRLGLNESLFRLNGNIDLRLNTGAEFFIYNALAALLSAKVMGFNLKDCADILSSFKSFPGMRMEKTVRGNLTFINDSYNSSPFALKQAVKTVARYPGPKIAIVGDMLELGKKSSYYHRAAAKDLIDADFACVLTVGRGAGLTGKELIKRGHKKVYPVHSAGEAAVLLKEIAKNGKYLIFIKGSRSMGLESILDNFKERKG